MEIGLQLMETIEILNKLRMPSGSLAGKVVAVHGAARGILGAALPGLVHLGAAVAFVDKREDGAALADELRAAGGRVLFLERDLVRPGNTEDFLNTVLEEFGRVDIMIHNAVHFPVQSLLEMSMEDWDLAQATNVRPAVVAAKMVLPGMLERKSGVVLNMMGPEGMAFAAAMSAAKMALRSFTFSTAAEVGAESGVSVLGFAPGLVDTELVADVFPRYTRRIGIEYHDYVYGMHHNPGYRGLMPAEHAAGSLIHALVNASEHHGLIADSYTPLIRAGIIQPGAMDEEQDLEVEIMKRADNSSRLKDYIDEISSLNARIENKIRVRTAELRDEQSRSSSLLDRLRRTMWRVREKNRRLRIARGEAESAARLKSRFLANMSHELRTPMNALLGMVQLMREGNPTEEQSRFLEIMEKSGGMLLAVINDILDLSKIESGEFQLDTRTFRLKDVVDSALDLLRLPAREKGLTLSRRVDENIPELVRGDDVRIGQILTNLISNAVKFTSRGEVQVAVLEKNRGIGGGDLEFRVRDTGMGIAPELRADLFSPFVQADDTRTRTFEGTGLGLSICRKLVEQMGGAIDVESTPGEGSTFVFEIPVEYEAGLIVEERPEPEFQLDTGLGRNHPLRILLVEDNEDNQVLAGFVLKKMGYEAELAVDGLEAVHRARDRRFDLILMDIHMPRMDGLEATRRILEEAEYEPRIVIMSANTSAEDERRSRDAGARDFLRKPFVFKDLAEIIKATSPAATRL